MMSKLNPLPLIVQVCLWPGVAIALATVSLSPLAQAIEVNESDASNRPIFVELCEGRHSYRPGPLDLGPHHWKTMAALMAAVATEDCAEAQQRLMSLTEVRLPELSVTDFPSTALMVDFPMVVDLRTIAIATPNLTRLDLSGKVIEDLSPISALTHLRELHLANTQLQDISALPALQNLTTLDVSYNQIDSIAPLAAIPTLRSLNLAANPFSDLSPLGEIYTPYVENEWRLLNLSDIHFDLDTCPDTLGDICEGDIYGEG